MRVMDAAKLRSLIGLLIEYYDYLVVEKFVSGGSSDFDNFIQSMFRSLFLRREQKA